MFLLISRGRETLLLSSGEICTQVPGFQNSCPALRALHFLRKECRRVAAVLDDLTGFSDHLVEQCGKENVEDSKA